MLLLGCHIWHDGEKGMNMNHGWQVYNILSDSNTSGTKINQPNKQKL